MVLTTLIYGPYKTTKWKGVLTAQIGGPYKAKNERWSLQHEYAVLIKPQIKDGPYENTN